MLIPSPSRPLKCPDRNRLHLSFHFVGWASDSTRDFALPTGFTSWDVQFHWFIWALFFNHFIAPQKVPGLPAGANL